MAISAAATSATMRKCWRSGTSPFVRPGPCLKSGEMNIRFDGKVVAVTGAGHGFGRAIAQSFAGLGARVFATDLSTDELAGTASPGGIATHAMDLRDRAAGAAWVHGIERETGRAIDVLVNDAGGVAGQEFTPVEAVSDEAWNVLFDINVNAAFALCR